MALEDAGGQEVRRAFDPYLVARPGARGAQQFESVGDIIGDEQFASYFIVGSAAVSARKAASSLLVF